MAMTSSLRRSMRANSIEYTAPPMPGASTALVAEDDEQIAYILRFILEREGFQVHLAPDGRTAKQLIETLAPPELALLDVMLPHADGYELLGLIRAKPEWK